MDLARSLSGEVLVLVVCGIFWLQTSEFEQPGAEGLGPAFLPRLLIILLVLCVVTRIAQALWSSPVELHRATERKQDMETDTTFDVSARHLLQGIALAVSYVLAATYLGYPLATFLVVLAFVGTASRFTWTSGAVAFGVALAFPYLFVKVVFIDLPKGVGVFYDFTIWLYGLLGIY